MTCICGVIKDGKIYMGGDSASSNGNRVWSCSNEKVFINGPFIMGFTTSWRMGQLLRYSLKPPRHPAGMDDYEYMVTIFIDAVRRCLKSGGFAKTENSQEEGGTFIVGYKGKMYEVHSDYQVALHNVDFASVGCGSAVATGALYASKDLPPEKRIILSLEAAERFCEGVRGPFNVISSVSEARKPKKGPTSSS